jgi:hypothetical protein
MLGLGRGVVASGNRGLKAPEVRLDRTLEEPVLVVLAERPSVPLSL